mgnify:CR=1 FL=1|jgi:hypothetical protein
MSESFEQNKDQFRYPDVFAENGELERVAQNFEIDLSVLEYQAQNGELITLEEDIWSTLENSDSPTIETGDWKQVEELSLQVERNWEDLKNKLEKGIVLEAPIIMKFGNRYHLVAGNTRLMVSKAMGVVPKVLLFEIEF